MATRTLGTAGLRLMRRGYWRTQIVAEELVDVVTGLWGCWKNGAIVADRATGI